MRGLHTLAVIPIPSRARCGATSGERRGSFDLPDSYLEGPRRFGLMTSYLDAEESTAVQRDPGFDEGVLRAGIAERYPFDRARTACASVESSQAVGGVLPVRAERPASRRS